MRTGRRVAENLWLSSLIPNEKLRRSQEYHASIAGLSGGAAARELFIADSENNVVRAFDLSAGRLYELDAFKPSASNESVENVAYSAESNTLFVATLYPQVTTPLTLVVHSLSRSDDEWRVVDRKEVSKDAHISMMRVLRGRIVLVGIYNTEFVHVCPVEEYWFIGNCTDSHSQIYTGDSTRSSTITGFCWLLLCKAGRCLYFVWTRMVPYSRYRTLRYPAADFLCSAETLC